MIDYWFLESTYTLLTKRFGFNISRKDAQEIEDIVDSDLGKLYYVLNLKDESLKWFRGPLMSISKERGVDFRQIIPPYALREFGDVIVENRMSNHEAKNIFYDFINRFGKDMVYDLTIEQYSKYDYDCSYWEGITKKPRHLIDELLEVERSSMCGLKEIEDALDKLIEENQNAYVKAISNPKARNWFLGQIMKQFGGNVDPKSANELIENRFSQY